MRTLVPDLKEGQVNPPKSKFLHLVDGCQGVAAIASGFSWLMQHTKYYLSRMSVAGEKNIGSITPKGRKLMWDRW